MALKTVYAIVSQMLDDFGLIPEVFESEENAKVHVDRLRRANKRKEEKGSVLKTFYVIEPVHFVRARKNRKAPDPDADCYRCGLSFENGGGRNCDCDK